MTKVVCLSDLHGLLPDIPECDLLLIGGDSCPLYDHSPGVQTRWLRHEFNTWLRKVPAKEIVGIAGNHDFILEKEPWLAHELNWRYLSDTQTTVDGLKIWGTPWSTRFGGDWAFMLPEGMLAEKYRRIPRDIDILITHGPPNGYGDAVPRTVWKDGDIRQIVERTGSTGLANQLHYEVWENLKLIVFGHIHEGYGEYLSSKGVKMVNAAYQNYDGSANPIVVVDL